MRFKTLHRQRILLLMMALQIVYLLCFTGTARVIAFSWAAGLILYVLHVLTLHRGKRWLGRMFLITTLVTGYYGVTKCEQIGSVAFFAPLISYMFIRTAVSRTTFYARRIRRPLTAPSSAAALSTASP